MTDNYWRNLNANLQHWDTHNSAGSHDCSWPVCPASFSDLREFLVWVGFPVADKAIGIFGHDLNEKSKRGLSEIHYVESIFTPPWGPERAQEAQNQPVQNDEPVDEGESPLPEAEFQSLVLEQLKMLAYSQTVQNNALRTLLRKASNVTDDIAYLQESVDDNDDRSTEWMDDLTDWFNDEETGFNLWVKDAVREVLDERAGRE